MKNYRTVLGLPDNAGAEDIKAAFRKLAMKHHPDRGGNTATFQSINEAYTELEKTGFAAFIAPRAARQNPKPNSSFAESPAGSWQSTYPPPNQGGWSKPEAPSGTWQAGPSASDIDDILDGFRGIRRRNPAYVQPNAEIVMTVPIREAARGFEWRISRQKQNGFIEHVDVVVPGGLPDGHRGRYTLSDGSSQILIMRIEAGNYKLRGTSNNVGTIFEAGITTGDVEIDVNMDAIDLITGTWFEVEDFMGERLTVRVPAGFNPDQRLKVAGKGYYGWNEEQACPTKYRKDMYIKLRAIYNSPDKIDRAKILKLYNAVGGWEEANGEPHKSP